MTQPLTEALVEAAREAARTDVTERDQVAWNLPRAREEELPTARTAGFDWADFSRAYYPGSRRHDLRAITAYAAYKRSSGGV